MHNKVDSLPVRRSNPPTPPVSRHHSASDIVHRVKESLTTRVSKLICGIFLSLLLCLGIVTFILWISLRPHRPRVHISGFSISGLSQSNGYETSHISFKITARNPNQNVRVYYDSMNGSVYYKEKRVGSTKLTNPFYQDPKNTSLIEGALRGPTMAVNKDRWLEMERDRNQGKIVFRLEVRSVIRFKVYTWHSKSHKMIANCYVEVGWDGMLLSGTKDKKCPVYFT
ncbi:PREDICTED: protein YLS9-like [Camelina sativa]|uniref:Protein YLS9-like n=1 Tax=Camelina sativa TaxID=90675 RepID=A0ABM0TRK5_CAMSA|nr:PREDICTED: protein YLS9-like [Camelina sativa]